MATYDHVAGLVFQKIDQMVTEPIHPSDAFDMIVGTSTGGVIAMALLAGNPKEEDLKKEGRKKEKEDGEDVKRERMTVKEVMDLYEK